MVRERFIARWRRMVLTMGFTAFLHGRVSKILSFKLRLSDPVCHAKLESTCRGFGPPEHVSSAR